MKLQVDWRPFEEILGPNVVKVLAGEPKRILRFCFPHHADLVSHRWSQDFLS